MCRFSTLCPLLFTTTIHFLRIFQDTYFRIFSPSNFKKLLFQSSYCTIEKIPSKYYAANIYKNNKLTNNDKIDTIAVCFVQNYENELITAYYIRKKYNQTSKFHSVSNLFFI